MPRKREKGYKKFKYGIEPSSFFLVFIFSRTKQIIQEKSDRWRKLNLPLRDGGSVDGNRQSGGLFQRSCCGCMTLAMQLRDRRVVDRRIGSDLHAYDQDQEPYQIGTDGRSRFNQSNNLRAPRSIVDRVESKYNWGYVGGGDCVLIGTQLIISGWQ